MKARYSRSTILGVLAFVAASGGYGGYTVVQNHQKYGSDFETRFHTVVRVVDGDTIEIEDKIKVRLLGINAPERGECYFEEAKKALEAMVEGKEVTLGKDITGKDRYDRLLRYVTLPNADPEADDVLINSQLLSVGAVFSEAVSPDTKYRDLFASAQA